MARRGSPGLREEISSLSARLRNLRENKRSQVPPVLGAPCVMATVARDSSPMPRLTGLQGACGVPMNPAAAGASVLMPGFKGAG